MNPHELWQKNEERYQSIYENSSLGIFETTLDGRIIGLNPACANLFGYDTPHEMISEIDGKTHSLHIEPEKRAALIQEAVKSGSMVEAEMEYRRRNNTVFTGLVKMHVIQDNEGELHHLFGFVEDITERRKAAEADRLRHEQLIQADKLASLGVLVSGIAHEINNPNHMILTAATTLSRILADLETALNSHADGNGDFRVGRMNWTEMHQYLPQLTHSIREGSERIRYIVHELREFAQTSSGGTPGEVNLNAVTESAITLLADRIRKTTDNFEVHYTDPPVLIRGHYRRLEQVLVNLIQNACDAVTDRNQGIRVRTENGIDNSSIHLFIEDEGAGIPEENIKQVIDPFFTTRRTMGHTGLGLSIASSIIEEHGGCLDITSGMDGGTRVMLHLPADNRK